MLSTATQAYNDSRCYAFMLSRLHPSLSTSFPPLSFEFYFVNILISIFFSLFRFFLPSSSAKPTKQTNTMPCSAPSRVCRVFIALNFNRFHQRKLLNSDNSIKDAQRPANKRRKRKGSSGGGVANSTPPAPNKKRSPGPNFSLASQVVVNVARHNVTSRFRAGPVIVETTRIPLVLIVFDAISGRDGGGRALADGRRVRRRG